MKKTTSFHLEEDILKEIDDYKKEYNLSSRNVALERMLLERRFFIRTPVASQPIQEAPVKVEKKEEKKKTFIGSSVDKSYDSMPD